MKKNLLLTTLLLGCLLSPSLVQGEGEPVKEKPVKCPGTVRVLTETVAPVSFDEYLTLEEVAQPLTVTQIVNSQAGTIVKIEKTAGSLVKAGEVIMVLDVGKGSGELVAAQEELKKAQKVLRARQNWKVRSPAAEKQSAAKVAEMEAQVAQIEALLAATQVLAPVDGTLVSLQVNEGEHISQNFLIGAIHDLTRMRFSLDAQAARVSDGQPLLVKVRETEAVLDGMVKKNAPDKADLVVNNADGKVLAGQHGIFDVLVQNHPAAIVVDQKLIQKDDVGFFLYTVTKKRAKKTPVTLGAATHGKHVVTLGLIAGNELITAEVLSEKTGTIQDGFPCLRDDKKVKVVKKPGDIAKPVVTAPVAEAGPAPVKALTPEPEKTEAAVTGFSRFHVGAGASFFGMLDTEDLVSFKYYYSNLLGFGLDAGYRITRALDIAASFSFANSQEKDLDWTTEKVKFSLKAITLDLRYAFLQGKLMDVYAGAGVSLYPYKDTNPIMTVSGSAFGFNFMAGTYVHLVKKLDFHLGIRYNLVKKTIPDADRELILDNAELMFGLSYNF
jgi:multidrug efflux pump subunit AcrA (membrane-fusion protein)/opacity protein-like surface antigen